MLHFRKLPGRIMIVALALLLLCSSVLAVGIMPRSSTSRTDKNGIYHQIGASGVSWKAATYVLCNDAEFVSTTVSLYYNTTYLGGNTDSGVREATAEVQAYRGDALAEGTCYATIDGVDYTGPTIYAIFD